VLRRVAVHVPPAEAEITRARLLELFPDGLEERSGEDWVELAVYTDEAGEVTLRHELEVVSSERVAPGWEERWREFHRPVRVGGLWIGPPWEKAPLGEPAVVVDPGRAFGTGAHPTTRACIELLAGLERGSVLDAGCGSGVIAVAAVRLGFGPVTGLDLDPVAVEVASETAHVNGVTIEARVADVIGDELPPADVLVANIELRVVEALLERRPLVRFAVTSGYLAGEAPHVGGWEIASALELDGWGAHVLVRRRALS
jgi:ribosomal protein L11 methyltransferase